MEYKLKIIMHLYKANRLQWSRNHLYIGGGGATILNELHVVINSQQNCPKNCFLLSFFSTNSFAISIRLSLSVSSR